MQRYVEHHDQSLNLYSKGIGEEKQYCTEVLSQVVAFVCKLRGRALD